MKAVLIIFSFIMMNAVPNIAMAEYKVDDNIIYSNDKQFAQVKFLKIPGFDTEGTYTGIAVFYFDKKEQIWICPEDGWRLKDRENGSVYMDIDEISRLYDRKKYKFIRSSEKLTKYESITGGCFDYKLNSDAIISLKQPGMFWNSTIEFDIINRIFR